jgi:hypothetical protein
MSLAGEEQHKSGPQTGLAGQASTVIMINLRCDAAFSIKCHERIVVWKESVSKS